MEWVCRCCAGLDVHKKLILACILWVNAEGQVQEDVRKFGTMTRDLLALSDWLAAHGVTHVAMESTGVYWKPVYNILEGRFEVLLVNAEHIKHVPGRKTDVKDCQWIAKLLQAGLLRGSFIPPKPIRELRDLTRHRSQVVGDHTRVINRIQKTLEDANIKLASVAADVWGASGQQMLGAMTEGEQDAGTLAEMARGRLRSKRAELERALEGRLTEHHRFMLKLLMNQAVDLEKILQELNHRIEEKMRPFEAVVQRLDTIPGVDRVTGQTIVAEIGTDMSHFPTAGHLASWAGMCPGNHESAGKHKSGRTRKGSRFLKVGLIQAAQAAGHTKETYLSSLKGRLSGRRGKKRAAMAVAHSILVSAYYIIKDGCVYNDLGEDYLERLDTKRHTKYYVKKLERLGYKVTLETPQKAA